MRARLRYGHGEIALDLPDSLQVDVISTRDERGLSNPREAVASALQAPVGSEPLGDLLSPETRVGILFSDITRATPNELILPPLLAQLREAGVAASSIKLFNATGTHRQNSDAELATLLGTEIASRFAIVQNDATDGSHRHVGTTRSGNEIHIHPELLACDLKILTGYIEPHFFAGFSGGGKAVMPGCASLETIRRNHCPANIDDERATWGVIEGNPIAAEVAEAVEMVGGCFLLNVALNRRHEITGVFAGEVRAAHARGCEFVRQRAMQPVGAPYDVVVTSNAGYPLDSNLYQSIKGLSAAARITKPGGHIVVCAACEDGVPEHGAYARMLRSVDRLEVLHDRIRTGSLDEQDVWQVQIQCAIASKASVYLHSEGLTPAQITACHFTPVDDPTVAVLRIAASIGPPCRVCLLPDGPETIPHLESPQS